MILSLIFVAGLAQAQNPPPSSPAVTISTPKTYCKIEGFEKRKGKGPPVLKACDSLKDTDNVESKSMEDCRQRGLEKAKECIKKAPNAEQIAVKGRFTQKFSVSQDSSSFTCEMDSTGNSACP